MSSSDRPPPQQHGSSEGADADDEWGSSDGGLKVGLKARHKKGRVLAGSSAGEQVIDQVRLFIAGAAGSGAGKSTICLSILDLLLRAGYAPADLAYIKPATQGIQQTLAAKFCKSKDITCRHVGPLVFFKGFTQKFCQGQLDEGIFGGGRGREDVVVSAGESGHADVGGGTETTDAEVSARRKQYTKTLHTWIRDAVEEIAIGKKVVLVDGVGYPAVGSVVGLRSRYFYLTTFLPQMFGTYFQREGAHDIIVIGEFLW